ncbi:Na+/H+ antiporter subunit A [Brachybacterium saurashtrense]|uniref:Na+/H+ antiporter subunit A n=1 Tax=Brachybacterium saurashtrense TaxID=556288 RepID=A0A345YTJ4_9MICO|nr:Na+/H+ antiporter subunit A [Brachybacterium saurashtrense]AXK47246.1 Na+/H+ antiporter subunit A [Brachybacterium saurashtrense]RRR24368.1 Na+/H+ antiporter subunit A [Brachybacterium saurashtrense]
MLLAHLAAALVAPLLVRWIGRSAFYLLAAVPAGSALWLAGLDPGSLTESPREQSVPWIPALGIDLAFRLDTLSWVLTLIATGIGAVVLVYCAQYFKDTEPGLGRFAGVLTAFAGAMVGLVLADDVMMLYTFWELTTVFSYLLVGHYQDKQASRRAALNALLSTTAGGLAMLVGLLMVAAPARSLRLSAIVTDPMWQDAGPYLITAVLLILVGATSKSALVPTHFWLPGAMAAPTPVSAYLHAAAMVKAGVYLILRLAPALTHLELVSMVLAAVGAATMLVGGWRALRQTDIKLLLAYGTVSQLGFLAAVAAPATHDAVLAGLAMLLAHAVFKAPLFMVVGIIDKKFGTRDLRMLSGVGRAAPVVAAVGVLSAASMAAVPPLYGFVAKESLYTALWIAGGWQRLLLAALVAGSVLTVAYSWRFVRGAFGAAPGAPRVRTPRIPVLFWLPAALLALFSLGLAAAAGPLEEVLRAAAAVLPEGEQTVHLAVVPHLGVPLLASALTLALGAVLCVGARPVAALQKRLSPQCWADGPVLEALDAERGFRRMLRLTDAASIVVTTLFQRGSLPYTLGTMLVVLIALVTPVALTHSTPPDNLVLFQHPLELVLLPVAALAAVGAARSRRRLRAVFLITVTGYCVALLFLVAGSPDVAITQALVETAMTVVLVLVLRRLPIHFSRRPLRIGAWGRWAIAIGTAVVLCGGTLYAADARNRGALGPGLIETAYTVGGGHNVVNVTLVDARVWDTMGEISVLLVVATGVASLIFVTRRERPIARVRDLQSTTSIWRRRVDPALPQNALDFDARPDDVAGGNRWRTWLSAGLTLAPERRMVLLEVITRIAFPMMMMFSVYLLMAGHNLPGGGFAGGLVAGLALALRYLAGGRYELSEAAPVQAGLILGGGMAIAVLAGVLPLLVGGTVFATATPVVHVPLLGELHLPSALIFDVGVYLVVVGVMLDFLRSLGAQIDQQQEAESDAR